MPKDQRSSIAGMDYYRSPPLSSNALVYPPMSSSRGMPAHYYEPVHQPVSHNYANQHVMSSYANGGPVQQPPLPPLPTQTYSTSPPVQNSLRPSSGAWNPVDDRTLMAARKQGMNWGPLQATYFPTKTPNACRKRHERLMERKSTDDWDAVKSETLAKHYIDMRKEIWSGLAAATGEKWNVVEQKCMSSGLKNLQTSSRAYARRQRIAETQPGLTPYETHDYALRDGNEDSGISVDLEYDHENGSEVSSTNYNDAPSQHQHHYSYAPSVQASDRPDGYPLPDPRDNYAPSEHERYASENERYAPAEHERYPASEQERYVQDARDPYRSRLTSMDMGIDAIINRPH